MTKPKKRDGFGESLGALCVPRPDYYVTPVLFAMNAVIFVIMAFYFKGDGPFSPAQLISCGANYGPLLKEGQWFRLITCMFLHADVQHLLMNLYGLLFAGMMFERVVGSATWAAIYFGAGLIASLASAVLHPQFASVGASGAIFGLWGFMLVVMVVANFGRGLAMLPVAYFALYVAVNLLLGLKTPGVDNTGHLAGLLGGAVGGAILRRRKTTRRKQTRSEFNRKSKIAIRK